MVLTVHLRFLGSYKGLASYANDVARLDARERLCVLQSFGIRSCSRWPGRVVGSVGPQVGWNQCAGFRQTSAGQPSQPFVDQDPMQCIPRYDREPINARKCLRPKLNVDQKENFSFRNTGIAVALQRGLSDPAFVNHDLTADGGKDDSKPTPIGAMAISSRGNNPEPTPGHLSWLRRGQGHRHLLQTDPGQPVQ